MADGARRGRVEAVIAMLGARGVAIDGARRERILGEIDVRRVDRRVACAATCAAIA